MSVTQFLPGTLQYDLSVGGTAQPKIPASMTTEAEAPEINAAQQGLSGGIPQSTSQPAAPPQEPEPHESVARHIIDALGGTSGKPGDWARGIIAGGLAAAANVGKVPEGGGFLYGASRGAAGLQEQRRAQEQDIQKAKIQNQEMQLKQKADARAEQELQIHLEDTKVQRAMWTAQTAASIANQQRLAAEFPNQQKETQLKIKQLSDQITQSEQDQLAVLSAAGVDVSKLEHITSYDQLTASHAKDAASGGIFAVPNGQEHKEGEDGAGAYIVPGNVWEQPITKPVTITTGYEIDKNGKATPKTTTAQEGTTVGTLLAIAKGAQMDLANKQKQVLDQANIAEKRAQTFEATERGKLAESQIGTSGPQKDILGGTFTPPAGGAKEANKIKDTFKKDADELAKTESTYNQFQSVLNDINAGKDLTGAQSVVALFNAIGISATPLKGMGMRINSNTVEEHENARGLGQSVYQKFLKLRNGDVITPQQIKDYASIAMEARRSAYVNKINEVRAQGIDPSFLLPRGNGRPIDANTAKIFYDAASGGTPQEKAENAKRAAQATEWKF